MKLRQFQNEIIENYNGKNIVIADRQQGLSLSLALRAKKAISEGKNVLIMTPRMSQSQGIRDRIMALCGHSISPGKLFIDTFKPDPACSTTIDLVIVDNAGFINESVSIKQTMKNIASTLSPKATVILATTGIPKNLEFFKIYNKKNKWKSTCIEHPVGKIETDIEIDA